MRPLVIHFVTAPDGGGAERLVRELTARLPDFGIDAEAIFYRNPRSVRLTHRETCLGLDSVQGFTALRAVRGALRDRGAGARGFMVHGHLTWPLYHLALLRREMSGPLIFTEHNTSNRRRLKRWLQPMERRIYNQYDRLVAISGATHESLAHWLADTDLNARIETIENGSRLLPPHRRVSKKGRAVRIVSVGSLSPQKGFDLALRAIAKLGDRVEQYTILGEGPERRRLELMVKQLGLQQTVRLPGYCDDIVSYLHEADLGVIPSRWEGFGLVVVEALSTGLPVVVSDVPGLSGVVSGCDAAVLVAPENAVELERGLRYGIDHLVGRIEIEGAARSWAEKFTIEVMVARYAEMYKNLSVASPL